MTTRELTARTQQAMHEMVEAEAAAKLAADEAKRLRKIAKAKREAYEQAKAAEYASF